MAVHTYRFASTSLPGLGVAGTGYTASALGLVLYYDVAIDTATESLTDLTTLMAERGFSLFATDPTPTVQDASNVANSDLIAQTFSFQSAISFTSAVTAFGSVNNGAEVVNPGTSGQLAVKLGDAASTNLLVRFTQSGRMSAAGTSTSSAKARLGYTTSNTAGTTFTANSLASGSVAGTGTTTSGWVAAGQWLITGLAAGNYYFYLQLIAQASGTASLAVPGGYALCIDEVPA